MVLRHVHPRHSLVVLTADHGASFLGKGSPYEAGIRVPLVVRWRDALSPGRRFTPTVTHLDLMPTLIAAASSAAASSRRDSGLHGVDLLPAIMERAAATTTNTDATAAAASSAAAKLSWRPIFIEVGYARAVRHQGWKLIVVNDPYRRCAQPRGPEPACRNLHGQRIDAPRQQQQPQQQPQQAKRFGLGNMTYDSPARHPAFCEVRQLYDLSADPLERTNLVTARPDKAAEMLQLLVAHVRRVEAGNPAVARQTGKASRLLGCA